MTRKRDLADSFTAAAATYDRAAAAQACAADRLMDLVLECKLPANPTVLEVGCGTGLLTRRLMPQLGGHWLVTDLSAAMVAAARAATPGANAAFRVMDAEQPDVPAGLYDLVVSNMAAQWFGDLGRTTRRLLACLTRGGTLAFSTLGRGSFVQWRRAHDRLGLACGTPLYPTAEELAAILPDGARVVSQTIEIRYADGFDFLDSLKRVGAGTPAPGYVPLTPGAMRRVMREMGAPAVVTYDVLHAVAVAE
jgi:Methylase involved in ubiquinone/menaquinone biosynthesis